VTFSDGVTTNIILNAVSLAKRPDSFSYYTAQQFPTRTFPGPGAAVSPAPDLLINEI